MEVDKKTELKSGVVNGMTILVVDDEPSMRDMLEMALKKQKLKVKLCGTLKEATSMVERGGIDLILTDVKLPDGTGLDLLLRSKSLPEKPPVLLMTAFGSTDMAVEAMKMGAFHYLTKPFKLEELNILMKRALEKVKASESIIAKKGNIEDYQIDSMIGKSQKLKGLKELILRVSQTKTNILITGESGTGKELVARAIHFSGPLKTKPFVIINCGAIPENLMESEMFGYKKGSFTGAYGDKEGLFSVAHNGSIFLDEVGELPLHIQVKLLRVLQERSFRPVGGTETLKVDVRLISATNRNLEEMVKKGQFREDLFYRLNVINIHTPTLRERREDITFLVEHFLRKFSLSMGKDLRSISPEALAKLRAYEYPGNIRELQNIMERAVALEGHTEITLGSLPPNVQKVADIEEVTQQFTSTVIHGDSSDSETPKTKDQDPFANGSINLENMVAEFERYYILKALDRTKGMKKEAARLLGITFRSFRYRMSKYGIDSGVDDLESEDEN